MCLIKWGIVGTGFISDRFTEGLKFVKDCEIAAVASRDISKAKAFADKYGIPKYYGSYEEMARGKHLDVVYIGTPNTEHVHNTLLFLDAGFNVLCEKPLGVNAKEVKKMIQKAKENNVFLMEGMWTRFFPAMQKALQWAKSGRIGQLRMMFATLGYVSADKEQWRFKRNMAGGALMDLGVYLVALAFSVFGTDPYQITTTAHIENEIDVCNTFSFKYKDGKIAVLSSALSVKPENKVFIYGSKGCIKIDYEWWRANKAELIMSGENPFEYSGVREVFELPPYPSFGFQYEAEAVQKYLKGGHKEAAEMTLEDSLKIVRIMDQLRKEWNVVFDSDNT